MKTAYLKMVGDDWETIHEQLDEHGNDIHPMTHDVVKIDLASIVDDDPVKKCQKDGCCAGGLKKQQ